MRNSVAGLTVAGLLAIMMSPGAARAGAFSDVFVFGDSLSDTGNIVEAIGTNFPNPPSFHDSFTNGKVAMEVLAEHYAAVAQFWTPNRESYTGLGQHYVDDPTFRQRYDAKDPALAQFLRDATAAYAVRHLS